jgi:hypothetical protein
MRAPKTEGPHRLADLEQQRNSLDFNDTSAISPRDATPPIVSMLIANAVATFDVDPGSSRGYLARAFAC